MPNKVVETPYPLIDADPHASRVIRYLRPSDYAAWAGMTAAFPSALYLWGEHCPIVFIALLTLHLLHPTDIADPVKTKLRTGLRLGGLLGFVGGFFLAYQRSSSTLYSFLAS